MPVTPRALVVDQLGRCDDIEALDATAPGDLELSDQRNALRSNVQTARTLLSGVVKDPLAADSDVLISLRTADDLLWVAELWAQAVVNYRDEDRLLTRVTRQFCEQVGWPLPTRPIVSCRAEGGFRTWATAALISVTPGEHLRTLAWPDIAHELAHALFKHDQDQADAAGTDPVLTGDFTTSVLTYTSQGVMSADLEDWTGTVWLDWLEEYTCDLVATYLLGPSYGHQHVRVCSLSQQSVYFPESPELSTHPPDHVRAQVIAAALRRLGAPDDADRLVERMSGLATASGDSVDQATFDLAHPPALVDELAQRVCDGCRALNLQDFTQHSADSLSALLNQSWKRFLDDPAAHDVWEASKLSALRKKHGLPDP